MFKFLKELFKKDASSDTYEDEETVYIFTGVNYIQCTPTQYALYSSKFYFKIEDAEYYNKVVLKEYKNNTSNEYNMSFIQASSGKGYMQVSADYCIDKNYKLFTQEDSNVLEQLKEKYYNKKNKKEIQTQNEEHYKNLLKDSTELKKAKKNHEAIEKISEALKFFKSNLKSVPYINNLSAVIKLAKYLKDDKQYEASWKVLDDKRMEVEETFFKRNQNLEALQNKYDSLVKLKKECLFILKKEKKYTDYYFYLFEFFYTELVHKAFNGDIQKLNNLYDKLNDINNIDLKMIKEDSLKNKWYQVVIEFLEQKRALLFEIAKYFEEHSKIDKSKLKQWGIKTNPIQTNDYYNKHLSEDMSILKV